MSLRWDFSDKIRQQIRHFPPHLKSQVRRVMDEISRNPKTGKMLSDELQGFRSYRIGTYRLIYHINEGQLVLVAIGPRESIYEAVALEIGRAKIKERAARYKVKNKTTSRTRRA